MSTSGDTCSHFTIASHLSLTHSLTPCDCSPSYLNRCTKANMQQWQWQCYIRLPPISYDSIRGSLLTLLCMKFVRSNQHYSLPMTTQVKHILTTTAPEPLSPSKIKITFIFSILAFGLHYAWWFIDGFLPYLTVKQHRRDCIKPRGRNKVRLHLIGQAKLKH